MRLFQSLARCQMKHDCDCYGLWWRQALPAKLQALLGYTQGNYALGYYSDPDGRDSAEAGILAPETALGAQPQTDWVFTEKGYKDESNF